MGARRRFQLSATEPGIWHAVAAGIPGFVCLIDRQGRMLWFNRTARGLDAAKIRGRPFYEFVQPEYRAAARAAVARVFDTGKLSIYRAEGAGDDGATRFYETRLGPVRMPDGQDRALAVSIDITEARRMQRIQERYEAIFRHSSDAIGYMKLDGTFVSLNRAFERLIGYEAGEAVGRMRFQDLTPPEYRLADERAARQLLRTRGSVEYEKEFVRKDGRRVPVSLTAFAILDRRGRVASIAAIIRDVSERKRLEREILETGAREQAKLGRDLHDTLGQTLTGLSLLAKSLRGRLAKGAEREARDAARIAALASVAIEQSRALARGLIPSELHAQGLPGALQTLAENSAHLFGIDCRYHGERVPFGLQEAGAVQLYRIAQEAVLNAVKHGRARKVEIVLGSSRGRLLLRVQDDGRGFDPTLGEKGLGRGIMSYRAKMLGGQLDIRPGLRRGTVLSCSCPLSRRSD